MAISGLGASALVAASYRYPNGTVSPYPPALFGIGHIEGLKASKANAVAAEGANFYAAVGDVSVPAQPGTVGFFAVLYNNGLSLLPRKVDETSHGSDISGSGGAIVGSSGTYPAFWLASQQYQLGYLDQAPGAAHSISADGLFAAGELNGTVSDAVAVRWQVPSGERTLLGRFPGYNSSRAIDISANGQIVCGTVFNNPNTSGAGPDQYPHAFRMVVGGSMELLGSLPGHEGTAATAISADGQIVVGLTVDGALGFVWTRESGMKALPISAGGVAQAFAISGDGKLIGGQKGSATGSTEAAVWELDGDYKDPTAVDFLLYAIYGLDAESLGWTQLRSVQGISQDGHTLCGEGVHNGATEGFVAVLPPFLYPPRVHPPKKVITVTAGDPFSLSIKAEHNPTSFTAEGLPKGFAIDNEGRISGVWFPEQAKPGRYTVTITATNNDGTGTGTLQLELVAPEAPKKSVGGLGFLEDNKAPGETVFPLSTGRGISPDGNVAIAVYGVANDARAFRTSAAEGIEELPRLEGATRSYTTAVASSADGEVIVGEATDPATNFIVAALWKRGVTTAKAIRGSDSTAAAETAPFVCTSLGYVSGGDRSFATAVSADGKVVAGWGNVAGEEGQLEKFEAFRWTAEEGVVGLGWLAGEAQTSQAYGISPDGSIIVGSAGSQAFRWTKEDGMVGIGHLPNASAVANAVSADGKTVVGSSYSFDTNLPHAFRWTAESGIVDLGVLPGDNYSVAYAVSADGKTVVGQSRVNFGSSRAFIWDATNGMRDLRSVILADNPQLGDWQLTVARGISADGTTIVGYGTNPVGQTEGFGALLVPKYAQLLNISTRASVLTGDNVLIGGFIVTGNSPKPVIVRAIGPSLTQAGVAGALANPTLQLFTGGALVASNDDWRANEAAVTGTGIPPTNDAEAAIVQTLAPGAYTAVVSGQGGGTGVALVEVYDLSVNADARLANISTRGVVGGGEEVMIGGTIIGGNNTGTPRVLVRAIGPSLAASGVAGALDDPMLELYDADGVKFAANSSWRNDSAAADIPAGVEPKDDREAAILIPLLTGAGYTAIVRGENGSSGVALVEAYQLQ